VRLPDPTDARGVHNRAVYVALLGRLVATAANGALTIRSGGEERRLLFVGGSPVWFESSRETDQLGEGELEDLDARLRLVKRGIGLPLRWDAGWWSWDGSDGLPAELLMRAVFLDCSPLAPLWSGVQEAIRQDEVLDAMTTREAGPVSPTPSLAHFADLGVEGPLAELADAIGAGATVPELLRRFAHEHQAFFKLLWLVELLGWVERDGDRTSALVLDPAEPPSLPSLSDEEMRDTEAVETLEEPDEPGEELSPDDGPDEDDLTDHARLSLNTLLTAPAPADEPETKEVQALDLPPAGLPSVQVADAIRAGVPDNEWSAGPEVPLLTRTAPSANPSQVMPDLPSYRPSRRPGARSTRYVQSNVAAEVPRRPEERAPVDPPARPVSAPRSERPRRVTGPHQAVSGAHRTLSGSHRPVSTPPRRVTGPHQALSGSHQALSGSHRPVDPRTSDSFPPLGSTGSHPPVDLTASGSHPPARDGRRTNPQARRVGTSPGASTSAFGASLALSAQAVARDHRERMGNDFYTFLGVPQMATQAVIDRAWTKLLKRWTSASKNKQLPDEVRQMARELAQVAHLAGRTFSVPARRQEYDRRLARGSAPLAGGVKAARTRDLPRTNPAASMPRGPETSALAEAKSLMAKRDFERAATLLRALRVRQPSDPDLLAELGWASWKASAETNRDEAEEFLQLAITFNPRHTQAREYLARIALDLGDHDRARQRLERLLKLKPDATWARAALGRLPAPEQERSGRRLTFWKK